MTAGDFKAIARLIADILGSSADKAAVVGHTELWSRRASATFAGLEQLAREDLTLTPMEGPNVRAPSCTKCQGEPTMHVLGHQAIGTAEYGDDTSRRLRDQLEVVDALYRFGLAQDLRHHKGARELFASAFADDAVLDFRPAATKCGLQIPLMTGRDSIVATIMNPDVHIDTTHVVTNPRVRVDGATAQLSALVEAQHLPSNDHTRHALLKNIYAVRLVRDGAAWVMSHVHIDNVWFTGDPSVIIGQ
jgi:hypothetical protein